MDKFQVYLISPGSPFHCIFSLTVGNQHTCKSEIRAVGESPHQQAGSKIEAECQAVDGCIRKWQEGNGVHQETEWRSYRRAEAEKDSTWRLSKAQFSSYFSEVLVDIYIFGEDWEDAFRALTRAE